MLLGFLALIALGPAAGPALAVPQFEVDDLTVTEGASGEANASIRIFFTDASDTTVSVDYSTSNGTATAGSDYTAKGGTVSFAAGDKSAIVKVPIFGDTASEADETFKISLSNANGGGSIVKDSVGTITIKNDDPQLSFSISDATLAEGSSGSQSANFTLTLSPAPGSAVSVSYSTSDGTATAGSDYTAGSGIVTFNAGETTKTLGVLVTGDTTAEPDETFNVTLSGVDSGVAIADATGVGTIANDDGGSAAPGADRSPPGTKLSRPSVSAKGVVKAAIACPKGEQSCTGYATFRRPGQPSIGTAKFDLEGGSSKTLQVRLPAETLRVLRARGTLRVNVTVVATDAAGNRRKVVRSFNLKSP